MSGWIGGAQVVPSSGFYLDDRLAQQDADIYSAIQPPIVPVSSLEPEAIWPPDSFRSPWWPASSGTINGAGMDDASSIVASWGVAYPVSGANGRFSISGYTRAGDGSLLPGVTVKLFRTSDDSLQASVVSDAYGYFLATSPYADGHYLVTYKAGPPDVCGTTVNTLTPS